MVTPSAQLLAAADRIRDLAAAATPGPWRQHDGWWPGTLGVVASVLSGEGTDTEVRALLPTYEETPNSEARNVRNDAAWVAALSPAVAEPLIWILEAGAQEAEAMEEQGEEVNPNWALLKLARVLVPTGETP